MVQERKVYVTETDLSRLEALVNSSQSPNLDLLRDELADATVVKATEVPPDVVTMNSRIKFLDLDTQDEVEITLVYPHAADAGAGKISILAPVGSAVFGLSVGDEIAWPMPGGNRRLKITSVLFQPEAAGRFDL